MITIPLTTLTSALAAAAAIVERNTANPALVCVHLSPGADLLTLTTTDTLTTLTQAIPATCAPADPFLVDASTLLAVVKALPGGNVHLTPEETRLKIACGPATQSLRVAPAADYPPIPRPPKAAAFTIPGKALARLIAETSISVSADDNRYGLNGTHVETVHGPDGADRLRFVTTDASRLSCSEATFEGAAAIPPKILLPRKALAEVRKAAEGAEGDWSVAFSDRSVHFTCGGTTLVSRTVEGEFPDYRQVLPASFKRTVTVDALRLAPALKAAKVIANDKNHLTRFDFQTDRLILSATNADGDHTSYEVPIDLSGKPILTAFNLTYFQDILAATRASRLTLQLGEALDPCIVTIPDLDDRLFVVMPMRLE